MASIKEFQKRLDKLEETHTQPATIFIRISYLPESEVLGYHDGAGFRVKRAEGEELEAFAERARLLVHAHHHYGGVIVLHPEMAPRDVAVPEVAPEVVPAVVPEANAHKVALHGPAR